ncbi:hypothetical protein CYANOKiyG1_73430 [Okeania sp. KiyG1]|nr:hypothetical protein CYANOKiyG1_73430 [Okeania sp. KiyG1]
MFSELTGAVDFLKVCLLIILGVTFITESKRKSLNPLGFLLFAIGSDNLIKNVYIRELVTSTNIRNTYLNSANTLTWRFFLTKGVSIVIIIWILVILIPELRVRLLLKNRK